MPDNSLNSKYTLEDLQYLMARLRDLIEVALGM